MPKVRLTSPRVSSRRTKSVSSVSSVPPRVADLSTTRGPLRLQRPSPLPTTRQPARMLSAIHAFSYDVATPARSGSPGAQVVSRQRLSIRGTERQDILFHENSCKFTMVEARKSSSSGAFLPQKRGVSVISPPTPPLHASPLLVQNKDVEFVIQDLSKGDSLGAYAPLRSQGSNFLCRARVHTQASGKQRMVHNYRYLNSFCKKQTCRYEQVKDLHKLLRPHDWLLSLDVSAAY